MIFYNYSFYSDILFILIFDNFDIETKFIEIINNYSYFNNYSIEVIFIYDEPSL